MIFAHILIGLMLGKLSGNYPVFILGSIFPDFDHIYIMVKNRFFSINKIISSMKSEEKFGVRYKTPSFHSLFGLILSSGIIYFFNNINGLYFAMAYLLHLLMDWPDIDEKYYLYPLKIKFKGVLPIWSRTEQIFTSILVIVLAALHW